MPERLIVVSTDCHAGLPIARLRLRRAEPRGRVVVGRPESAHRSIGAAREVLVAADASTYGRQPRAK